MAHDPAIKEKVRELFVVNGFSMETITTMLPEVSRKTLYNWRKEEHWDLQRRDRSVNTSNRREKLEAIVDRLLDELNVKLDPKLIFSLGKIIAAIRTSSTFEFVDEKKQKEINRDKGYSEDNLRELEEKFLNL